MGFIFSSKKEEAIITDFERYIDCVDKSIKLLKERFPKSHSQEVNLSDFENPVHRQESKADDLRREMEIRLYQGSLLPNSRGDILGLLESYDLIPNHAEEVMEFFALQDMRIPEDLFSHFVDLLNMSCEAVRVLNQAARLLFHDFDKMLDPIQQVDELESAADKQERQLLYKIFTSDLGLAHKMLLRDLIRVIGGIADRAENVADRLHVIIIKRRG